MTSERDWIDWIEIFITSATGIFAYLAWSRARTREDTTTKSDLLLKVVDNIVHLNNFDYEINRMIIEIENCITHPSMTEEARLKWLDHKSAATSLKEIHQEEKKRMEHIKSEIEKSPAKNSMKFYESMRHDLQLVEKTVLSGRERLNDLLTDVLQSRSKLG